MRDNQEVAFDGEVSESGTAQEPQLDEMMLRTRVQQAALQWVGTLEGSPGHAQIVSIFNSICPSYPITMDSSWCAAFASVVAYQAGVGDIFPINPRCTIQMGGFQTQGRWVWGSSYKPQIGDFVYYNWDAKQDPDHVGIVVGWEGNKYVVCEGNKQGHDYDTPPNVDRVGLRYVEPGSSLVYGIGVPNYGNLTEVGAQLIYQPVSYYPPNTETWAKSMDGKTNWLRRYRLEAGLEGQSGGFVIGDYDGPNNPPLRIQFNVEKADMETPNNSTIKIWNLGTAHRNLVSTPGCYIKLFAGYGDLLPELTEGMIAKAVDSFDGGNIVTEIEIVDIRKNIRDTYTAISVTNMVGDDIIRKVVKESMGLSESMCSFASNLDWFNRTPIGQYVYCGTALGCIEDVCKIYGYKCTILNGLIEIHSAKKEASGARPVVISAETGMIGNPKRLIETEDGVFYLRGWQVDFMLVGGIDLGTPVQLESPFVDHRRNIFDVVQLNITGDSMDGEWKCSAKLQDPYFSQVELFNPKNYGIGNYTDRGSGFTRNGG